MQQITLDASDRGRSHALHERILGRVQTLRSAQVALAHDLAEMREKGLYLFLGATSYSLYCEEKAHLTAPEGFELAAAADAFAAAPALLPKVLSGKVALPAAAAVGKVLKDPSLVRAGEDWLLKAETETFQSLTGQVKKRLAEKSAGGPVFPLKAWLSARGIEDFARARTIVIQKKGRFVGEGETIEIVVHDYLERHDPERKAARMAERDAEARAHGNGSLKGNDVTLTVERSRNIPEAEKREVLRVAGDRCRVERCEDRSFLKFCHRVPFALGGPNRAENLLRLCDGHHKQMDGGVWKPVRKRDGSIVMIDLRGVVVGRFRSTLAEAMADAPPADSKPPP